MTMVVDLKYDPETGILSRPAGKKVCSTPDKSTGYLRVNVGVKMYQQHRVAFFLMEGRWPKEHIDHINRVKTDNRWCNLREATNSQNSSNNSGEGISWHKAANKWSVQCMKDYKKYHGGLYTDRNEALEAAKNLKEKLHGEFA